MHIFFMYLHIYKISTGIAKYSDILAKDHCFPFFFDLASEFEFSLSPFFLMHALM